MKRYVSYFLIICLIFAITCFAESDYKIGTANTSVYVRSIETGEIQGSLAYGDKIYVEKISAGWCIAHIGDKTYKVYSEYISFNDTDKTNIRTSVRKQGEAKDKKPKTNSWGIIEGTQTSHKINKDSPFSDW